MTKPPKLTVVPPVEPGELRVFAALVTASIPVSVVASDAEDAARRIDRAMGLLDMNRVTFGTALACGEFEGVKIKLTKVA